MKPYFAALLRVSRDLFLGLAGVVLVSIPAAPDLGVLTLRGVTYIIVLYISIYLDKTTHELQ
jgi:hypothetical protein